MTTVLEAMQEIVRLESQVAVDVEVGEEQIVRETREAFLLAAPRQGELHPPFWTNRFLGSMQTIANGQRRRPFAVEARLALGEANREWVAEEVLMFADAFFEVVSDQRAQWSRYFSALSVRTDDEEQPVLLPPDEKFRGLVFVLEGELQP